MKLLMASLRPVLRALLLRFWLMERIEAIEASIEHLQKTTDLLAKSLKSIPCKNFLDMDSVKN